MTARIVAFRPVRQAALLAAGLALVACGVSAPPAAPSTGAGPTPADPPVTTGTAPPVAADDTDYTACHDGSCTVEVRAGTTIAFDGSLRVSSFRVVSIDGDRIALASTYPSGGSGSTTTGAGGSGRVNGVAYRVLDVRGGTAVLEFRPA